MRQIVFKILGFFLIILGVLGLVLPILPGLVLIFIGLSLCSPAVALKLKGFILKKTLNQSIVFLDNWNKEGVTAGFTTRHFPVFVKQAMDLDSAEMRQKFAQIFPPFKKFVHIHQAHGDNVLVLEEGKVSQDSLLGNVGEADGLITNIPGVPLFVLTADCLSIFLLAKQWVGIAHAGWRGTQRGIAKKIVTLLSQYSGVEPSKIRIIFGPCIGRGRYEVGPEFRDFFPKSVRRKKGKIFFDLAKENTRQLLAAGVPKKNITDNRLCTISENRHLYSFRHEKDKAGRIVSFIMLNEVGLT